MPRKWIFAFGLAGAIACGSPDSKPKPFARASAPAPVEQPGAGAQPARAIAEAPTGEAPTEAPPTPPPITIPNGRLYDGYVVGGLPSREQFEQALQAGFESAMSLMGNDEEGIRDVAPYASSLGIRYIRFTVQGTEDLNESMAWQFASTLGMLGKPAIIHSARGERVGALFALMAFFVDELSVEDSISIGLAAGLGSLADDVRSLLTRE